MQDYSDSPPSLHRSPSLSDRAPSSRESTPVSTPVGFGPPVSRRSAKDTPLPWFKRPIEKAPSTSSLFLDSTLTEPQPESDPFPLFGTSPTSQIMAASPIDIQRQSSMSPRDQKSNLTTALQGAKGMNGPGNAAANSNISSDALQRTESRSDSISMAAPSWTNGTSRPISMGMSDRNRRESFAASMTGGMSWGGISVGSFIRDDMIMTGTSPFTFQSPSYHSSSYLPKLEANFMRDFSCCGTTLPTLHDLLQHYEEAHAEKPPQGSRAGQDRPAIPNNRAAIATNTAAAVQEQAQRQEAQSQSTPSAQTTPRQSFGQPIQSKPSGFQTTQLQTIPDMDTVEDMEMDDAMLDGDATTPPGNGFQNGQTQQSQSGYGQTNQPRITPLNVSMMQGQSGLRSSQPSTPVASGRPLQNNPTVSSVNTPTLMANPMQQQLQGFQHTPDSSAPGTPGEIDESLLGAMGDMSMQNNPLFMNGQNFGLGFGTNNDMLDLCIDEPAKRLFSPTGGSGGFGGTQNVNQFRLGNGQYSANSDIARRIREQQMAAGLADTTTNILPHEEPKPFRCPVIGCEKAYKNQNGLKYHKAHGHNNQRLHENGDGTFSIVDPETSAPYPGTMGMEKEKPYKCETCGKRYKNLNGLKYHKAHSPPCNPEIQAANAARQMGIAGMIPAQTINPSAAMAP